MKAILMKAILLIFLLACLIPMAALAQPSVAGKWSGEGQLPDGAVIKLYLTVTQNEGQLQMSADILSGQTQPPFGLVDFDETEPSLEGSTLRWKLRDGRGNPVLCEASLNDRGGATGVCKAGEMSVAVTLRHEDSNPWVSSDFQATSSSEEEARHVNAAAAAVRAFGNKDFDAFDELFTANTVGMQPNEIYNAAFRVVIRNGTIRKLEFVEFDGDSALLRMYLGETWRDFIV
ncbi:MAG: hypothetical protein V3T83_16935, partial [Acidobacteriota bacterium]